jgi:hypothetical protein
LAESAPTSPQEIVIDALDADTMALWRTVAKIAQVLDDERIRWTLVGGLMVALYAIESGQVARPTVDCLTRSPSRTCAIFATVRQSAMVSASRASITIS